MSFGYPNKKGKKNKFSKYSLPDTKLLFILFFFFFFLQLYSLTLWSSCRYLLHVMNVATPTKDCLELVRELLEPLIKARSDRSLTRQEVSLYAMLLLS